MYGCYNRPDFIYSYVVFDGYFDETRRFPITKRIPVATSKDCQYSRHTVDVKCDGCKHQQTGGNNVK